MNILQIEIVRARNHRAVYIFTTPYYHGSITEATGSRLETPQVMISQSMAVGYLAWAMWLELQDP